MNKLSISCILFIFSSTIYAQSAYRNYEWGMTINEVTQNSDRILKVDQVTRFSDVVFDVIAKHKNYIIDGVFIRPVIFNHIKNERQLYDENIAFYFENNRLVAINIYHIDVNHNNLSRDDIIKIYGQPIRYEWKHEDDKSLNVLELFTSDGNRYIILQSITQNIGNVEKIVLKHLTYIDRNWIDNKMKIYFDRYNVSRINSVRRLLD